MDYLDELVIQANEDRSEHIRKLIDCDKWIVSTPGTCSGSPRVIRTRIRVSQIVQMIHSGISEDDIIDTYPCITKEAIQACIMYNKQQRMSTD